MSRVAVRVDDRAASLSLPDLLTILDSFGVDFCRRGEAIGLKNAGLLSAELRESVTEHKADFLALADCRADLDKLHGHLIRLRCENPPKGSRSAALAWLEKQIAKLAALSVSIGGTEDGWLDPADVFADGDQITALRVGLAEVEAGPYPLPLPEGCHIVNGSLHVPDDFNIFAAGRLLNGARCV